MIKKFCYFVTLLLCYFVVAQPVRAAGEFSADYDVLYEISPSGAAIVTSKVTLTNKLTNLYAREYSIVFDSTRIKGVIAYDDGGQITPEITQSDGKTTIKLRFNTQVVGVGKKLGFSLRFENDDIAHKLGSIWEVNIPGIVNDPDLSSYWTSVSVPPSFGQVAYISPLPAEGKRWNREQMIHGGVSIAYGVKQQFLLNLSYYMENSGLTKKDVEIALPPDTAFQKVTIASLDPAPVEISQDSDGNWLARYSLGPNAKQDVTAQLYVAITIDPRPDWVSHISGESYTTAQRFWESTDPAILSLARILKDVTQIYRYVVDTLSYDYTRVDQNPIRKGARAALASPKSAICMEFTDLFIALARAKGIPSREVIGFAYTTNTRLRPLSLVTDVLHSWPEYYDYERRLWIPVDPTWEDTTGGIDYFSKLDFNHITFAIQGIDSDYPYPAGFYRRPDKQTRDVNVSFAQTIPDNSDTDLATTIEFPRQVLAGFEAKGIVRVNNIGSTSVEGLDVSIQSQPAFVSIESSEGGILPFSSRSFPFVLATKDYFASRKGRIIATVNGQTNTHEFSIKPAYLILLPAGFVILIVVLVLFKILPRRRKE